jgi:hypothetical protein
MGKYTIHFTNGITRDCMSEYIDRNLPGLDKVFAINFVKNGKDSVSFFRICEMSEEEIWVEDIMEQEYFSYMSSTKMIIRHFVFFNNTTIEI